jgi:acetyl-CoA carboxylase carboxyl transferase subunit alpha
MLKNKLIDGIIEEPLGGAHENPKETYLIMKNAINSMLDELTKVPSDELIKTRIAKFSEMGSFTE